MTIEELIEEIGYLEYELKHLYRLSHRDLKRLYDLLLKVDTPLEDM